MQISLDSLGWSSSSIVNWTKTLIETLTQTLSTHVQIGAANTLEALPVYLNELSGAALFFSPLLNKLAV